MKEIKEHVSKYRNIFRDQKTQHSKNAISLELSYRFNTISIEKNLKIFCNYDKFIKYLWKGKGTRIVKSILEKKNKVE